MKKERRKHGAAFKFKVVLEALRERESLSALAAKFNIHPQQITDWKRALIEQGDQVFNTQVEANEKESDQKTSQL